MGQGARFDGRYELGRRLGRGGMAEVYETVDLRLGRTVAVKLLRRDLADDDDARARFGREARTAAGLNHPSIVAVHDTGEAELDGLVLPFLVMEYIDGPTLAEVMSHGPAQVGWTLRIAADVLSALAYAHDRGIVHRDIKPGNVMLTGAGTGSAVKVTDFGLARPLAREATEITKPVVLIGTAGYLSPEQIAGRPADARSDLYAAGCLLYALLTGRPPFVADTTLAVVHQHLNQAPAPPSALRADVPADVDRIVLHALAKDPANRFRDADTMRQAVLAVRATQPGDEAPPGAGALAYSPARAQIPAPTRALRLDSSDREAPRHDDPADHIAPARTRRAAKYVLVAVFALAALVAASYLGARLAAQPQHTVAVPDMLGASRDQAVDRLASAGLRLGAEHHDYSEALAGTVYWSEPPGGRMLLRGTPVDIWISDGPGVTIPSDLLGQSTDAATQSLAAIGLNVHVTYLWSDQPTDQVLTTDPAPGATVAAGSTVELYVSCDDPTACPEQ